jgi:hypothetical protein
MTKELVMEKTEKENPEEEKKIQDFFSEFRLSKYLTVSI